MENSAATGINGDQANNAAEDAGAVYVFTRAGDYLGAAGLHQGVQRGGIRSIWKRRRAERGRQHARRRRRPSSPAAPPASTAIRPTTHAHRPGRCTSSPAPAATWSQQAYVKASNTGELDDGDTFGYSAGAERRCDDAGRGRAERGQQRDRHQRQPSGQRRRGCRRRVRVHAHRQTAGRSRPTSRRPTPHAAMLFGYSVGLSGDGDTLTAGSFDERGCSNAINGPYEMKCGGTGAVYAFTRSGTDLVAAGVLEGPRTGPRRLDGRRHRHQRRRQYDCRRERRTRIA